MKNKFLNPFIIIVLILVAFIVYNKFKLSGNSHFTVTADTVIKPGSEISKYVTQEEVDSFAFRYWDIDTYEVKNNSTMENFRQILKSKNTTNILNFMKDNNISVDTPLHYGVTPLMYASFYDDEKTMKEFIKIGADTNATDKYKLNALAYAIENNSTKAVKTLLDSGVIYKDMWIQFYRRAPYYRAGFDKIVIDGDKMELYYNGKTTEKSKHGFGDGVSAFGYAIDHNYIEIVKYILESGYLHPSDIGQYPESKPTEYSDYHSVLGGLVDIPNHEPMLNLLLEHNISGQPSKELMKKAYDKCYDGYIYRYNLKQKYIKDNINKKVKHLDFYLKYCSDKNGTFKNTKEFINYKNGNNRNYEIDSFLYSNKDDPTKVIYIEK